MTAIAQVIGWSFLIAAFIGALVPGMNFHVGFSDDAATVEWHLKKAKEVQERINKKATKRAAAQKEIP